MCILSTIEVCRIFFYQIYTYCMQVGVDFMAFLQIFEGCVVSPDVTSHRLSWSQILDKRKESEYFSDFWSNIMAVKLEVTRKYMSYMKECCVDFDCANDFVTLVDRLVNKDFEMMFNYVHENGLGNMASLVPNTTKWKEFLFDSNDYDTLVRMENCWTTSIGVNSLGRHKIFAVWRVFTKSAPAVMVACKKAMI